jgi:hypothetical protein
MRKIEECYQKISDDTRSFDIRFWQFQGDQAIFEAVTEVLHDYFLIRGKDADEFRIQRDVESYEKNPFSSSLNRDKVSGLLSNSLPHN